MKKRNPSSGQNGQLVHWWLLIHSGRGHGVTDLSPKHNSSTISQLMQQKLHVGIKEMKSESNTCI
jgi:hypothetical protein